MQLTVEILVFLCLIAALAGFVDAIAGGGGLLTVPALLATGMPPVAALATNKVQSSFGVATACYSYARAGHIDWRFLRLPIAATFTGAALGAWAVQQVDPAFLSGVMPVLLTATAAYFLFSPRTRDVEAHRRVRLGLFAGAAAVIGFYDGFFGPGTGSFFAIAFVTLMGLGLTRATAGTKALNLTSNLVATAVLAAGGHVHWAAGLAMAAGQMLGGRLGSQAAMRWGPGLIRPLLVTVSLLMTARLVSEDANPWNRAVRQAWGHHTEAVDSGSNRLASP